MKMFICGASTAIVVLLAAPLAVMRLGLISVGADNPPPALEARLMSMALRASVARHATTEDNPISPTEESLRAGAEIYSQMCASCHGTLTGKPGVRGAYFYPPAPQLAGQATRYSEGELSQIIRHGIRNTGMPACGGLLSDDDIRHLAALVKRFDRLPPSVTAEMVKQKNEPPQ